MAQHSKDMRTDLYLAAAAGHLWVSAQRVPELEQRMAPGLRPHIQQKRVLGLQSLCKGIEEPQVGVELARIGLPGTHFGHHSAFQAPMDAWTDSRCCGGAHRGTGAAGGEGIYVVVCALDSKQHLQGLVVFAGRNPVAVRRIRLRRALLPPAATAQAIGEVLIIAAEAAWAAAGAQQSSTAAWLHGRPRTVTRRVAAR
jgi:hypothetical protein